MFKYLSIFAMMDFFTFYGGGGSSSSSSSNATTSTNIDKRQVVGSNAVGVTTDTNATVNVSNTTLDAQVIQGALDYVKATDATQGSNFTNLLALAESMFSTGADVIGKAQDTTLAQIGQINTAQNDAKGAIDQKTMVILAIAGIGAFALSKKG